jgi:hypothetical protein
LHQLSQHHGVDGSQSRPRWVHGCHQLFKLP